MELKKAGGMKDPILLMVFFLLTVVTLLPTFADGKKQDHHKERYEHYSRADKDGDNEGDRKERKGEKSRGHHKEGAGHDSERDDDDKNGKGRKEKEKGDEVTGFIAAGLFGLANLSTLFSTLSRSLTPFAGGRKSFQKALFVFIRFQQKHLRRYHYLPNIAAITVASLHWYLSECASLSFQQWGMVLVILLGFSGIITKYRLAPKSLHPALFKFHSSILVTLAMSFLVVGGHVFMDD
jgi:hypothetical protein